MQCGSGDLQVYETGKLTVVGFGKQEVIYDVCVAECRDDLAKLIQDKDCESLAFDLAGVEFIPSGMIGLLAAVCELGIEVYILNASQQIREMLTLARLDSLVQLREVNLELESVRINRAAGDSSVHRPHARSRISRLRKQSIVRSVIADPLGEIVSALNALTW